MLRHVVLKNVSGQIMSALVKFALGFHGMTISQFISFFYKSTVWQHSKNSFCFQVKVDAGLPTAMVSLELEIQN